MTEFIIIDWCSNICLQGKTFATFEDAWEYIYLQYENVSDAEAAEAFQDYEVIENDSHSAKQ